LIADDGTVIFDSRAICEYLDDEGAAKTDGKRFDIGTLTVACALGYLDFRFPQLEWRSGHPEAAAWFAATSERPSLQRSAPSEVK
jgi:glutathione S-transferase